MKLIAKQIVVIFYLLFLSNSLFADSVDSLQNLINKSKEIQKIEYQIQLIKIYREKAKFNEALELCFEALDLAIKMDNSKAQAELFNLIGKNLISDFREIEAREYLNQSIEIAQKYNNNNILTDSYFDLGRTYYYQNSYDTASNYFCEAVKFAKKQNLYIQESDAFEFISKIHQNKGSVDSSSFYIGKAIEILKEVNTNESKQELYYRYATASDFLNQQGEFQRAIEILEQNYTLCSELNDSSKLGRVTTNLGNNYFYIGNYETALTYYQEALKIFENIFYQSGIAFCYSKIGIIYQSLVRDDYAFEDNLQKYTKAKEYNTLALNIYRELNDQSGIAGELARLANVEFLIVTNDYMKEYGEFWEDTIYIKKSDVIIQNHQNIFNLIDEAFNIHVSLNKSRDAAYNLNQLGKIHNYNGELKQAEKKLLESLSIAKEFQDNKLIMYNYYDLGVTYYFLGNYTKAIEYLNKTLQFGEKTNLVQLIQYTNLKLSRIYSIQNNSDLALIYFKKYAEIKDHLYTESSQKVITEMQTKYETDKKEQEIKLLNNEKELQESVIKRQNMVLGFFVLGFLIVAVFVILLKRQINAKQRAYKELEEKNELISDQKREIEDSIHYASRIQRAVVPSPELAQKLLPEHFILWRPRDIVSGDFYWFTKVGHKIIIVAADCTGHGVPGAFMSMLGVSFLSEIVGKHGSKVEAHLILNSLRSNVKRTLKQEGKKDEAKDGMDIALCIIDEENMKMQFAGAYNPLYLFRNGELEVFKADKMPIGIHIFEKDCFTLQELDIQKGDTFYIFSDGYVDQFGGPTGRKFMVKAFKEVLENIQSLSMLEQKKRLEEELDNWMGTEYLQIDDILVVGFRY